MNDLTLPYCTLLWPGNQVKNPTHTAREPDIPSRPKQLPPLAQWLSGDAGCGACVPPSDGLGR